jgi:hypothetical protein
VVELDDVAADIARRCRRVAEVHDGRVSGAWSMREQLAVALVLRDRAHLQGMDFTPQEAAQTVRDGMVNPPADMNAWLDAIRGELGLPTSVDDGPAQETTPVLFEATKRRVDTLYLVLEGGVAWSPSLSSPQRWLFLHDPGSWRRAAIEHLDEFHQAGFLTPTSQRCRPLPDDPADDFVLVALSDAGLAQKQQWRSQRSR